MQRKLIQIVYYIISIVYLLFLLKQNVSYRKFGFYLVIDIIFLIFFSIKFLKKSNQSFLEKKITIFKIFFLEIIINHIIFLNFLVIHFYNVKFHYDLFLLFCFFLFLLLTNKRIWNYLPFLIFFALLSPPISIANYDHYHQKDHFLSIFFITLTELFLSTKLTLMLFKKKFLFRIIPLYIFLFILSSIQILVNYPLEPILYNSNRFILYGISFIVLQYFLKYKSREKVNDLLHLVSVFFSINLFTIVILILLYNDKIYHKANENFFAMFFDWSLILSMLQTLKPNTRLYKKILHSFFFIILFLLTMKVIIIFGAETSKLGIPLALVLTLVIFFINKILDKNFKDKTFILKYSIYFVLTIFVIIYILIYFFLWHLAKEGNSSLINRFFYWYVIYEYFLQNPWKLLVGLGEYQWGFLYKYLTFTLSNFSYKDHLDVYFYFHNHAHNDLISFLVGGGIFFLLIYLLAILFSLKNLILIVHKQKSFYIILALFLIIILHGITEPYTFSPYTGYVFWFISFIMIFFKFNSETNTNNISIFHSITYLKSKSSFKIIKKINILLFILFCCILIFFIIRYQLKRNVNLYYHYSLIPKIIEIYQDPKNHVPLNEHELDQKINKLEFLKFISLESETYFILFDFYKYKYLIHNHTSYLEKMQNNVCKGFDLNSNFYFYINIAFLSETMQKNKEEVCPELKDRIQNFDPQNIIQ